MYTDAQHEKGHQARAGSPSRARPCPADPLGAFYAAHNGYVSDKWHTYLEVYSQVFRAYRDRPVRIMEIGVQNGGSLEIWRRYFPRAEIVVGCDINPKCADLTYDDPAIHVVTGDARAAETLAQIASLSHSFDIIIDDGSHLSSDIVKAFALYFPKLAAGGLYVVEDLHCSYWMHYEGGLQAPYSSLSFFKRLADMVNFEHWGADLPPDQPLGYFARTYGVVFDPSELARIDAVCFYNSICILRKTPGSPNTIGPRVVAGQIALVADELIDQNGAACPVVDETANPWGPSAPLAEKLVAEAPEVRRELDCALSGLAKTEAELAGVSAALSRAEAELDERSAALSRAEAELAELAARIARLAAVLPELQSALAHPWHNLWTFLRHHASRGLSSAPFVGQHTRARISLSSAKRDPSRFNDLL
jgi:hypothetical protein